MHAAISPFLARLVIGLIVSLSAMASLVSPAAAQCGQVYRSRPPGSTRGQPPLAIGDSVLADAVPLLASAGFEADGMVCRRMDQGLAILRARSQSLPSLVVLALGTNGSVTSSQVDETLAILGPSRMLALVTPHHGDTPSAASAVRAAAAQHPSRIILLDWDRVSAGHPGWFAADGTHLGGSAGINAFASLIESALPASGSSPLPARPLSTPTPQRHPTQSNVPRRVAPRAPPQTRPTAPAVRRRLAPNLPPLPPVTVPPVTSRATGAHSSRVAEVGVGAAGLVIAGGLAWVCLRRRRRRLG